MDFYSWLSGFVTGEAWFSIKRAPGNWFCEFGVNLRDDDEGILLEVKDNLGFGWMSYRHQKSLKSPRNGNPQACFKVNRIADCMKLVIIFEAYPPKGKKLQAFTVWARAVRHMYERGATVDRQSTIDNDYLALLKEELGKVNTYQPKTLIKPENILEVFQRVCARCGKTFATTKTTQKWCKVSCRAQASYLRLSEGRIRTRRII